MIENHSMILLIIRAQIMYKVVCGRAGSFWACLKRRKCELREICMFRKKKRTSVKGAGTTEQSARWIKHVQGDSDVQKATYKLRDSVTELKRSLLWQVVLSLLVFYHIYNISELERMPR